MESKTCEICGLQFPPAVANQVTCSDTCRAENARRKDREKYLRTAEERKAKRRRQWAELPAEAKAAMYAANRAETAARREATREERERVRAEKREATKRKNALRAAGMI